MSSYIQSGSQHSNRLAVVQQLQVQPEQQQPSIGLASNMSASSSIVDTAISTTTTTTTGKTTDNSHFSAAAAIAVTSACCSNNLAARYIQEGKLDDACYLLERALNEVVTIVKSNSNGSNSKITAVMCI